MDETKERTNRDHQTAELKRLRAGYDGCSCQDCQEFYKTLDLSLYGDRVIRLADVICIVAGRIGAESWREYHQGTEGGVVSATRAKAGDENNVVSKIKADEIHQPRPSVNFDTCEKRGRGRPRKTGEISRMTVWRREQEKQGVLIK
jgi:hypothetical protein